MSFTCCREPCTLRQEAAQYSHMLPSTLHAAQEAAQYSHMLPSTLRLATHARLLRSYSHVLPSLRHATLRRRPRSA